MADERVQIKVEEIVGNDVVLKDINPKSSTKSIDDSATGATLEQTLDRMWNTINNKLSRIVNSVNGRTGVVVLNPSDVGLGNVDNVSHNDIKKWVINKLESEFGNKRIKLFNSLTEVDDFVAIDDAVHRDSPYYAKHGYGNDYRSYIGYIYLDAGTNKLRHMNMSINTVGYTDNTIVYDEKVNNNDKSGGGLGVNIYKYEDALKVYNGLGPKSESGLYIDKSKLVKQLYYFDGVYGDGTPTDSGSLLYFNTDTIPSDARNVLIFIDNRQVVFGFKLRFNSLLVGDLLFCNFKDYRTSEGLIPSGMSSDVMLRNPCLGKVTATPDENGVGNYKIEFYSIKPKLGWGLQYIENHRTGVTDNQIDIRLVTGSYGDAGHVVEGINISGLNVFRNKDSDNVLDTNTVGNFGKDINYLPAWTHNSTQGGGTGGLKIIPNLSLNISSNYIHGDNYDIREGKTYTEEVAGTTYVRAMGSKSSNNLKEQYHAYRYFSDKDQGEVIDDRFSFTRLEDGTLEDYCTIGVNLNRVICTTDFDSINTSYNGYYKKDNKGVGRFYEDAEYSTIYPNPWYNTKYVDIPTGDIYEWTAADPGKGVENEFKLKKTVHANITHSYNMSGLKINEIDANNTFDKAVVSKEIKPEDYGMTSYEVEVENRFGSSTGLFGKQNHARFGLETVTGGLGINIGKFLEIDPGPYTEKAEDYYDGGKLSVRIGKGLIEELVWVPKEGDQLGHDPLWMNRIAVNIQDGGGLAFDDNGRLYVDGISGASSQSTMSSPMMTSSMSVGDKIDEPIIETPVVSTTPNLIFTDNYGTTFEHSSNPVSDETTTINLGTGLKIIL